MSDGDEPLGGTDDARGSTPRDPSLSEPDMEAIDLLVEHGFDAARATAARPELAARIAAASALFGALDRYETPAPDAALTDATLARVDRETRASEERMRIRPTPRVGIGGGRWPDLWATACAALVIVAIGLPLANWMRTRAAESQCADHLRTLGGGIARYVGDRNAMPYKASLMPDFSALPSWSDLRNNLHLHELTDNGYAETRCLCCPNDPSADGYAYQVPGPAALRAWRTGTRVPVVADRSPAIELTRAGMPVGRCIVNSPDHGGAGQNALFTDASVEFVRTSTLMLPEMEGMPRHLENIYLPMSGAERGALEEGLDKPSDWIRVDVFLLN